MNKPTELIYIHGYPRNFCEAGKLARTGTFGATFFLSQKGTLYCGRNMSGGVQVFPRGRIASYMTPGELKALKRLGVFTAKEITASKKLAAKQKAEDARLDAMTDLKRAARKLGIPVPKIRGARK